MKLCKCGCGREVSNTATWIQGHSQGKYINLKPVPCLCGCGQLVKPPMTYIKGHSDGCKIQITKRLKSCQKHYDNPEWKKNLSNKMKEIWKDPNYIIDRKWYRGTGASSESYCKEFTDPYKKEIKEWDDWKCKNPYCYHNTEMLGVHHIDYDKMYCHFLNLITVCISCNSRANGRRRYWERLYKRIRKFGFNERCMFEFGA